MTIGDTSLQERSTTLAAEARPLAPELDPAKYRKDLADLEMTDAQKDELLGVLWSIMLSFVQLGLDVKSCGQILESFTKAAQADSDALDSPHSETSEMPTTRGGQT